MHNSKQMKYRNMDSIPNGPLEDLKKIGDILMRRTSEKGKLVLNENSVFLNQTLRMNLKL